MKTEAYKDGFFAYREEIGEAENPFIFNSDEYFEWRRGWYAARDENRTPFWASRTVWVGLLCTLLGVISIVNDNLITNNPSLTAGFIFIYGIITILLRVITTQEIYLPINIPSMLRSAGDKKYGNRT